MGRMAGHRPGTGSTELAPALRLRHLGTIRPPTSWCGRMAIRNATGAVPKPPPRLLITRAVLEWTGIWAI
jgi:hypothetical protein